MIASLPWLGDNSQTVGRREPRCSNCVTLAKDTNLGVPAVMTETKSDTVAADQHSVSLADTN